MKKLFFALLLLGIPAFGAESQAIEGWDAALPQIQSEVVNMIQAKAYEDFYQEDDGVGCGGDTSQYAMSDYYTFQAINGDVTSRVKVKFHVTGSYNYCRGVVMSECEAPLNIYPDARVSMGKWTCTVIDTP